MPRIRRLINNDEATVYHVMSRTALDGFPLGDVEKDFMLDLIRRYSSLYFVEILGFCLMGNHFHILVMRKKLLVPTVVTAILTVPGTASS